MKIRMVWWIMLLLAFAAFPCAAAERGTAGDWQLSTPEQQQMDAKILGEMDAYARQHFSQLHSILVVRHGKLVFEKYYNGYDAQRIQHVCSVTKTFTAALIGIAIDKGYIKGVDAKLADFYPEYVTPDSDPRLKKVTIEHLLTMTSGYAWDDWVDGPKADETGDPLGYIIGRPFAAEPGEKFSYHTGGSYLLSAILTKATGMKAKDFAAKYLFGPLGITDWKWWTDERFSAGGLGLNVKPRDMAKFGQLYLNQGVWNGQQIVPAEWIRLATSKHNDGGFPHDEAYGYHCWITSVKGHAAFFAGGYGGQFIFVVPELELVAVITSGWDRHHEEHRQVLVNQFIVPAVKR